jgi:hypothetical protein
MLMSFLKRNWLVVLLIALLGAFLLDYAKIIDIDEITLPKLLEEKGEPQETEPPVPVVINTDTFPPLVDVLPDISVGDFIVRVVNYTDEKVLEGFGVVVAYGDKSFVLTSRTIFSNGKGCVLVNGLPAGVVIEDEVWELVALRVYEGDLPALELDATESPEGGLDIVTDDRYPATVLRDVRSKKSYRNAPSHWMILTGAPLPSAGAPIFTGDTLSGLVIGRGTTNPGETIAAKKDIILKLLEKK